MITQRLAFVAMFVVVSLASARAVAKAPTASQELLEGSWTGTLIFDEEKIRQDPTFKSLPPEQAELAIAAVKAATGKVKADLTLNADGSATAKFDGPGFPPAEKNKTATYKVVSTKESNITISVTPEGKKTSQQMTFRFEDEKNMLLEDGTFGGKLPKGVTIRFKKQ